MLKKAFKIILKFFIVVLAVFLITLLTLTIIDYNPDPSERLKIENNQAKNIDKNASFKISTFNIGYCGLDKGQDFFMDGGTMSRSKSLQQTKINLQNITNFLIQNNSDYIFLQEVDTDATRSFHTNQLQYLKVNLSSYGSVFGVNYRVPWVPVPFSNPMGSVNSGLAIFSHNKVDLSFRNQYPGQEKWPRQLFELDRCFVENRYKVADNELIMINSHLSAFDKGGEIRKVQLAFLKQYIINEYNKGNYIIVGGDWNHVLPGTDPSIFKTNQAWPFWLQNLPNDFTPDGFKWAVDNTVPTVRTNDKSYVKDENFTAVIDGFLVSPNVDIVKAQGIQLDFENSDHNPVIGEFKLK